MTSETDRNDGPKDESLDSLPPELRIYAPAEGTPVRPAEPEKPAEPSYEEVPLASLSGTAQPQPAPPADPRPAKRVGLPSKFSLIALAGAAVVLVSVPFVVALLMTGQRETDRVAIGMNASQEQGALVAPEPALPAGEPVEIPNSTPEEQKPVETKPRAPVLDPVPPPAEAPAREVSLLGGPGCANNAKQQYQAVGYYEQGDEGWYTRSGGSTEAGCRGSFDSMPMSGKAKTSDSRVFSRWTFDVSAEMTAASCAMSVYIPNESDRRYVGATAAHYSIFNGFDQAATNVIGVKDIDQTANRGKWVDLGAHRIDQGKISVKLHNRGEDWEGGADGDGAHVAATQIRVTCTPA